MNHKQTSKRLAINKETLRELSDQELDQAAGGAITATATGALPAPHTIPTTRTEA